MTTPTLYTSTTTPYGRLILMIAYLQGIDLSLKFVMPWDNPSELTAISPFSQVPVLVLETGEVITETPLIIQAIAPNVYNTNANYNLPRISKALGIISQGVRAYATERFGNEGEPAHPFVKRSKDILINTLPALPTLSADSTEWGDKILLCALIWLGIRLPDCFDYLSDDNKQAVNAFKSTEIMQKTTAEALEKQPSHISKL